jgi:hypothetical protein
LLSYQEVLKIMLLENHLNKFEKHFHKIICKDKADQSKSHIDINFLYSIYFYQNLVVTDFKPLLPHRHWCYLREKIS